MAQDENNNTWRDDCSWPWSQQSSAQNNVNDDPWSWDFGTSQQSSGRKCFSAKKGYRWVPKQLRKERLTSAPPEVLDEDEKQKETPLRQPVAKTRNLGPSASVEWKEEEDDDDAKLMELPPYAPRFHVRIDGSDKLANSRNSAKKPGNCNEKFHSSEFPHRLFKKYRKKQNRKKENGYGKRQYPGRNRRQLGLGND